MLAFLKIFFKEYALNKKYIVEKGDEILRWPFGTFNDLWGHISFYKNAYVAFIEATILESWSLGVFFVKYRRTYVLDIIEMLANHNVNLTHILILT